MWRVFLCLMAAGPALADSVVATRPIAARAIVTADDVTLVAMEIPNALARLEDVVGLTTTTDITAGRALQAEHLTTTLQIERNAIVQLIVQTKGMEIRTEGRALSPGNIGDVIDIMNISSRTRISGTVRPDGSVLVTAGP